MPTGSTTYPTSVDDLTTVAVDADLVGQDLVDVSAAVEAIETELGTNPSGASATVVARLNALDTSLAAKVDEDTSDAYTISGASATRAFTANAWTITNAGAGNRTFNATSYTIDELAAEFGVLANTVMALQNLVLTLIQDLKDRSIIG